MSNIFETNKAMTSKITSAKFEEVTSDVSRSFVYVNLKWSSTLNYQLEQGNLFVINPDKKGELEQMLNGIFHKFFTSFSVTSTWLYVRGLVLKYTLS